MSLTLPFGYGTQRVTLEQLRSKTTFRNCHPEFQRRLEAMIVASGGAVGIGTAWRSPAAQDAERARRLASGTGAQMAPSNRSWHCAGAAADVVGDQQWAKDNCHRFGLYYATWAGESLWHQQPVGLPHARPAGADPGRYLTRIDLPGDGHVPPPLPHPQAPPSFPPFDPMHCAFSLWPFAGNKPSVRLGSHHEAVKYLQGVLRCKANQHITVCDGAFGPQTLAAVKNLQAVAGLTRDGVVAARTWAVVDQLAGG